MRVAEGHGHDTLEEVGFLSVKAFLVPVEAQEMVYKEDLVEEAHPQEL